MYSNLFKSYYVKRDTEEIRVIDSNEIVAQKMERLRMIMPELNTEAGGFEPVKFGLEQVDPADALTAEFTGLDVETLELESEPVYEGPTPEELIAQAQVEIQNMREQASREIEMERALALQEAKQSGYEAGRAQAMQELSGMQAEVEQERMQMQVFYEQQIDMLEPMFIRTLTGIYEKVFEVGLDNQQEIIVGLLRNTMKKLDGCKNFLVHVSAADYSYVKEHKADLISDSTQEGAVIDIVEDSTIRKNECMIETVNGIYDCGIGTQLEQLRNKLTLLSYDGQQES